MKDLEVRDRLLMLYKDYENKIISDKEIIRFVRDFYYQEVTERYIKSLIKDEAIVDENARKIVADKYGELKTNFPISRDVIESDPDIISKVQAQIKEMKMNNELEKDKMSNLRSIDTLEKLTREFLNFKQSLDLHLLI